MANIGRTVGHGPARYEIYYPKSMTSFTIHLMSHAFIAGQQRYMALPYEQEGRLIYII